MSNFGIEFVNRLETFRLPDEGDAAFARRIGISLTTLRDWKLLRDAARDFEPKMRSVRIVAERLDIDFSWLLLGTGEKGAQSDQVHEVA